VMEMLSRIYSESPISRCIVLKVSFTKSTLKREDLVQSPSRLGESKKHPAIQ
jgi:hypothetical protein